jgi:hypothetical protein
MASSYVRPTAARIWHHVFHRNCTAVLIALKVSGRAAQRSQLPSKSPADLRSSLRSSTIWLFYKSNLIASGRYLHNCRCFQQHLRMLLQGLRALYLAPGGSRSIYQYKVVLLRLPGVSERIVCCFQTDLRIADAASHKFTIDCFLELENDSTMGITSSASRIRCG